MHIVELSTRDLRHSLYESCQVYVNTSALFHCPILGDTFHIVVYYVNASPGAVLSLYYNVAFAICASTWPVRPFPASLISSLSF